MFKIGLWRTKRSALSDVEVDSLVKKIDALLSELEHDAQGPPPEQGEHLKSVRGTLRDLKGKFMKNDTVDSQAWQKKDEDERRQIGDALGAIFKELKCLNQDELRVGRLYFFIFFGLLLIMSLVYGNYHRYRRAPIDPALVSEIAKDLWSTNLEITTLKQAKDQGKPTNSAELQKQIMVLEANLKGLDLPFSTRQLLGEMKGQAERSIVIEPSSFAQVSKAVLGKLEAGDQAFLWGDRLGRWFEIVWWAGFGVLVGILFYVAGTLSEGRFPREEIAMFWTEAAIAPIVVPVIFFLFALIQVAGISPAERPITTDAGIAFILGFAIRRTLGLLDILKKKIFPEPQPASKDLKGT